MAANYENGEIEGHVVSYSTIEFTVTVALNTTTGIIKCNG